MRIGDRVRALHSNDEGIIVAFRGDNIVEIEIDEGFSVPLLKKELVVVSEAEKDYFRKESSPGAAAKPTPGANVVLEKSILLAFVPVNDRELSVSLLNNLSSDFLFVLHGQGKAGYKTLAHGFLAKDSVSKLFIWKLPEFENWPALQFQITFLNEKEDSIEDVLQSSIKFKSSSFFKSRKTIPLINKEGYTVRVDEPFRTIDAKAIKESLLEKNDSSEIVTENRKESTAGRHKTIDLHIDKIQKDYHHLSNEEIIKIQLEFFEKAINASFIEGIDSLKIIHGVGNGVLRAEVQKRISQLENVQFFEDSDKQKFGFGATIVNFK